MAQNNNPTVYKSWEDGFTVRAMTLSDALVAQQWFSSICPTSCDLSVALEVHNKHHNGGFYVGEYEGEIVASALRIPWSPKVYYGSYFYVVPKHRRAGFGRRLRDDVATPYVGDNILVIDAHDELLEMNKRKGYRASFGVTRYEGFAPSTNDCSTVTKKYEASLFPDLLSYDDKCFIAAGSSIRRDFLQHWVDIKGGAAVIAYSEESVVGYGCRRPAFEGNVQLIGPLYADNKDIARHIVQALGKDVPSSTLTLDICNINEEASALVKDLGFKDTLHMIRMYKNGDPQDYKHTVFGITSIDVCGF